jgi:type VI protein secretion system component VasK
LIASSYPFLDVLWTMFVIFLWIIWFSLLFKVFGDIFRRNDLSGWGKTGWLIVTIVLPFLGVFLYLITQSEGMAQRELEHVQAQRAQLDDYVRTTAGSGGGATAEIEKAKHLLDTGAINQTEFDALKQKALA